MPLNEKKRKILIITAAVVIIAGLTVFSILSRNRSKPMEVEPVSVILRDFTREVSANGEISSKNNTRIFAAVDAAVDRVFTEEGEQVSRDQVIITLDKESLENSLINAENAVINARMSVRSELLSLRTAWSTARTSEAQADRERDRAVELNRIGSVSSEELRLKEEALYVARANLDSARQKLNFREGRPLDDPRTSDFLSDTEIVETSPEVKKALSDYDISRKNIKYFEIKAETAGTVTSLTVDDNSVVEAGMMLAEIHDKQNLVVEAYIDEVDLSYIRTGQEVKITSDSFIGKELPGRVSKIAPVITRVDDSRVCAIEVDITENPDDIARIGASASIYIIVEEKFQSPAIEVDAYFIDENSKWVWKLSPAEDQDPENPEYFIPVKQKIETGILGIAYIEVTEGLSGGEYILSGRVPGIEEGVEVVRSKDKKKKDDRGVGSGNSGR